MNINKPFEFFDVTADIGFIGLGNTLEESFENSALAMFNVISNTSNVSKNKEFKFSISSEDKISLLYDFLEELLFLHETEFMLFCEFKVSISKEKDYKLEATVIGDTIDWDIYERGTEVKAVTFHQMDVFYENETYKTNVILDL